MNPQIYALVFCSSVTVLGGCAVIDRARVQTQPAAPGSIAAMSSGTVFRDCDLCPEMVVIPPGSFMRGSLESEQGRSDDEGPQHQVTIGRAFAVGKYEVSFDEWDDCVNDIGCSQRPDDRRWGRGRMPAIDISWEDAQQYVEWLSRRTAKTYRLLTEAQWEYAARAGTSSAFSFGDSISPEQANFDTQVSYAGSPVATSGQRTVPVGSYPANQFGLHDMHGNVLEWTEDCWNADYNGAPTDGSAWTEGACSLRVLRGGSWNFNPRYLRSAYRFRNSSSSRYYFFGFRVSRTD